MILSVEIARHFNTEIISADSRQFYREMTIGTAVPDENQLTKGKAPFHKVSVCKGLFQLQPYSKERSLNYFHHYSVKTECIVMTGGSGMYIDAVCKGIDDIPDIDPSVREKYNEKYIAEGIESLRSRS